MLQIYEYWGLLKEVFMKLQPRGKWRFFSASLFLSLSRVFQTAAFFLPLKILILISTDGKPHYFDLLPGYLDYNSIIFILVAAVPACFCGHVLFGILYRVVVDEELKQSAPGEIILYSGKKIGRKGVDKLHSHLSKAVSEIFLVLISLSMLVGFSPLIVAILILTISVNLWWFNRVVLQRPDNARFGLFRLHGRQVVEYVSSLSFVILLIVLVVYVMALGMGVYLAIFSLIFSRMVFQSVQRMAIELMFANRHLGLDNK